MSFKVVSKKVYRCICELCGKEWDTKEFRLPPQCPSCQTHRWNGVDKRRREEPESNGRK